MSADLAALIDAEEQRVRDVLWQGQEAARAILNNSEAHRLDEIRKAARS